MFSHLSTLDNHTQYNNLTHQPNMGFQHLSYSNQQQFNPQTMVYPQRPSSTSTPNFDGHPNRSPYFNYASHMAGQQQLQVCSNLSQALPNAHHSQSLDLPNNLSGFHDQQQRPAAPFIDPSFLTGNGLQRQRQEPGQSQ
jgi:hypothetical protein